MKHDKQMLLVINLTFVVFLLWLTMSYAHHCNIIVAIFTEKPVFSITTALLDKIFANNCIIYNYVPLCLVA
jgi:hypothetical protein